MPTIITSGAGSARGYGSFGGASAVLATDTAVRFKWSPPSGWGTEASTTFSLLPGYTAGVKIYAVGCGGAVGSSCCGNCGRSSSGENATFYYTVKGDESYIQVSSNLGSPAYWEIKIVGGTNNGAYFRVGSKAPACGYGNSRAPESYAATYSAWAFSRLTYGAYSHNYGNYYDDDYYYNACQPATYGNGLNGLSYDSVSRGASGNCGYGIVGGVWLQYLNDYQ